MTRALLVLTILLCCALPAHAQMFIGGGAAPLPETELGDHDGIERIALLVGAGTTLRLTDYTGFIPRVEYTDYADWEIDARLAASAHAYLSTRFEIVDIDYDAISLSLFRGTRSGLFDDHFEPYLGALPRDDIDAFVVIWTAGRSTSGTDYALELEWYDDRLVERVTMGIAVFDAQTLERISYADGRIRFRNGEPGNWITWLSAHDDFLFPNGFGITEGAYDPIRDEFYRLLSVSLVETLRDLELGLELPGHGVRRIVPMAADDEPYPGLRRIGLVSALGDSLEVRVMKPIWDSRDEASVPIADWQLDARIEENATAILGARYEIVEAGVDRALLYDDRMVAADGSLRTEYPEFPQRSDIDAYLAFLKQEAYVINSRFTEREGYGLGVASQVGEDPVVYARYMALLINSETGQLINFENGIAGPETEYPWYAHIDPERLPDPAEPMTPEQEMEVRDELTRLLDATLLETLIRMGLAGTKIEAVPLGGDNFGAPARSGL